MATFSGEVRGDENSNSQNREKLLVVGIDKNGKIVQFNRECEKATGYDRNQVLNKRIFDFLIEDRH